MEKLITGLHHITAIASDAQRNLNFYTDVLGMRLVKKTVNFEDASVYHLYYGDTEGSPGSILTFFPYSGLMKGRHGNGFVNTTTFSVGIDSLSFWLDRLNAFDVAHKQPQERFTNEVVVYLEDPDGLGLELVFNDRDTRTGYTNGTVPQQHAIKGIFNVELWLDTPELTAAVLTQQLNHLLIGEHGNRSRLATHDAPGHYIDLCYIPGALKGRGGSGTVHHIAFATPDINTQRKVQELIEQRFSQPLEIKNRKYFQSLYFREPGGVLFEVATVQPGFSVDEPLQRLGKQLMLPSWLEQDREKIEQALPPLTDHSKE